MSDYLARLLARSQPGSLQPAPSRPAASDAGQAVSDPFAEEPPAVAPSLPRSSATAATAPPPATQRMRYEPPMSAPLVVQTVQPQPGWNAPAPQASGAFPPLPAGTSEQRPLLATPAPAAAGAAAPTRGSTDRPVAPMVDRSSLVSTAAPAAGEQVVSMPKEVGAAAPVPAPALQTPPAISPTQSAPAAANPGAAAELQKLLRRLESSPPQAEQRRPVVLDETDQGHRTAGAISPLLQPLAPPPAQQTAPSEQPTARPLLSIGRLVVEMTPPLPPPARARPAARPAALRTEPGVTSKLRFGMGQL